jgi:acyl dehydratase
MRRRYETGRQGYSLGTKRVTCCKPVRFPETVRGQDTQTRQRVRASDARIRISAAARCGRV